MVSSSSCRRGTLAFDAAGRACGSGDIKSRAEELFFEISAGLPEVARQVTISLPQQECFSW
jgi:hypothetical protein